MTFWEFLVERTKLTDSLHISYDELLQWPAEQVEEAKQQGCLVQMDDAKGIICSECPKACWKDVEIKKKNGQSIGSYLCEDEDNAGIITIDIDRLQQWKIDKEKLSKLGYRTSQKKTHTRTNRKNKKQNEKLQIQAALLQHHGFETNQINHTPATQKELQKLTNWNQPKIHRALKHIFGDNPMQSYKLKCKEKAIIGFLKKCDDGSYNIEAVSETAEN